jgi:hypothetical protein
MADASHQRQAIVIRLRSVGTAYHCLPSLLLCPPWSYVIESTLSAGLNPTLPHLSSAGL